ncbi:MAG: HAD hydrolase family protein [Chloroflexi bacterium]|nr:HAD hydrolase family protein [Chloroflexota bacterium]
MANQSDIKLVAIDVDGTIMSSKNKLTDKTADALKRAHEQGVHIVIATGKTRTSADVIYKRVGFTTPGIFVQGLVITYPDGTEKHLGTLDVDLLRRVITFVEDRGLQAIAYSGKRILARRMTTEARVLTEHYDEPLPEIVGPLQNLLDSTPINKVMFCGGSVEQITHLRWQPRPHDRRLGAVDSSDPGGSRTAADRRIEGDCPSLLVERDEDRAGARHGDWRRRKRYRDDSSRRAWSGDGQRQR